ncbi:hypothetical protein RSOLAG22IIIB_13413 [Rhizoctonia solani]|uniref:Uncharacterized protein n=1 Tax=Rhizoctonia solani TaxID=456999 RepID=A0A0K6FM92_9AGAM|nr:hypothetical protein RSOLAG22IIIB_13413 [Rhizoctonia solani]
MHGLIQILQGENHVGDEHPMVDHHPEPPAGPNAPQALDTVAPPLHSDDLENNEGSSSGRTVSTHEQSGPPSVGASPSVIGPASQATRPRDSNVAPCLKNLNLGERPADNDQYIETYYYSLPVSTHTSGSSAGLRLPVHTAARRNSWMVMTLHGCEVIRLALLEALRLSTVVVDWMAEQVEVLILGTGSIRV